MWIVWIQALELSSGMLNVVPSQSSHLESTVLQAQDSSYISQIPFERHSHSIRHVFSSHDSFASGLSKMQTGKLMKGLKNHVWQRSIV